MAVQGVIDLKHLEKYVAGDAGLLGEILGIFQEQAEKIDRRFNAADDDETWHDAAHALKGASRGVGAWALGDLCEEAERLVGDVGGKAEKRAAMLVSIHARVSEAVADIARLRANAA